MTKPSSTCKRFSRRLSLVRAAQLGALILGAVMLASTTGCRMMTEMFVDALIPDRKFDRYQGAEMPERYQDRLREQARMDEFLRENR